MIDLDWPHLALLKNTIGWTVIHSLWQLTLVALLLYLLLRFIPQRKAELRYSLLLFGLVASLIWVGLSFSQKWQSQEAAAFRQTTTDIQLSPTSVDVPAALPPTHSLWDQLKTFSRQMDSYAPTIAFAWLGGTFLFSLYLLFGLAYLKYLEYSRVSLPGRDWQVLLHELSAKMGVKKHVRLFVSEAVDEPITFQLFRPVIMVPVFFFTGLTPAQIEVLLLHELAHIRRHDFIVNLLQSLAEILFFFHPAIWWISGKIREEREYCCDNAVLAVQQTPFPYVEALTRIQSTQFSHKNKLAMSANGKNSMLSKRVFRILGRYDREPFRFKSIVIALLLLLISFSAQAFLAEDGRMVKLEALPILETVTGEMILEKPETIADEIQTNTASPESFASAGSPPEIPVSQTLARDTLPLYVIDGVRTEGSFKINELKPDNIQAISVLKGEKALKKYGQAGEFGVIEITTKGQSPNDQAPSDEAAKDPAKSNETIRIRATAERSETTVQGKVTDENGQPLIGTNVLIKGTRTGTITDFNGEFMIRLPEECATLVFSYVGKETVELKDICAGEIPVQLKLVSAAETPVEKTESSSTPRELSGPMISGRILNEARKPLIGANILIKGTTTGTITDLQGDFRLQLPEKDCADLVISYIGMKTQTLEEVCGEQELTITLANSSKETPVSAAKPAIEDFSVFPNPADGEVNITFRILRATKVKLGAYTVDGKLIETFADQMLEAGEQRFLWSPGAGQRGIFLIQLEVDGKTSSKQLVIE